VDLVAYCLVWKLFVVLIKVLSVQVMVEDFVSKKYQKLVFLSLIVFYVWMILDDLSLLFGYSDPTVIENQTIGFPFYFLFFIIGAIGFFIVAKYATDPFDKRFIVIVAINFIIGAISELSAKMRFSYVQAPIVTIAYFILLIWSIKIFIQLLSKNKIQKSS